MGAMHWFGTRTPPLQAPTARRVVYTSRLRQRMDRDLLLRCRASFATTNALLGITGILVHLGDHFVQVLVAEAPVMTGLLRRISVDYRHTDFRLLLDDEITARAFTASSMSLLDLDADPPLSREDASGLRGFLTQSLQRGSEMRDDLRQLLRVTPRLLKRYPQILTPATT